MTKRVSVMFLIVAMISVFGCGVSKVSTTTITGDSVTNKNGRGTGTVAGVQIVVEGLTDGSASAKHSVDASSGPAGSSQSNRWEIELGKVQILLERKDNGPISLEVDGKSYGSVSEGDNLLIDASRGVTVNGENRSSESNLES
jgi:hypothetical protein